MIKEIKVVELSTTEKVDVDRVPKLREILDDFARMKGISVWQANITILQMSPEQRVKAAKDIKAFKQAMGEA